ncbi:MAG: UDP-N-acetylmuramoyl-tripeptide--D-alanyl-D-alanine ligase [Candidatus Binatia bacterium]
MTVEDVLRATSGTLRGDDESAELAALSTDSRSTAPRDLFVALRGDHFDGHDFVDDAIARGAAAVVCERGRARPRRGVALVEVDDTLRALGDIAAGIRLRFDIPVVAITGSNGKTSTKEMIRSILVGEMGETAILANEGNFNNLIGLPTTIFKMNSDHRVAVLEMGMNAPGEIGRLTEIASPTHGLITCIGEAHLEGLGSVEGVARAKGELFAGMGETATALVNLDDRRVVEQARRFHGARVGYGSGGAVRVGGIRSLGLEGSTFELQYGGECVSVELGAPGRHNVKNALAAASVALVLGVRLDAVVRGLAGASAPPMRLQPQRLDNGVTVINDAYNANPASLSVALEMLRDAAASRCIVVLGEMLELGADAVELHERAGREAGSIDPMFFCAMGSFSGAMEKGAISAGMKADRVRSYEDHGQLAADLARRWRSGDVILVKGSRGSAMEKVVEALELHAARS